MRIRLLTTVAFQIHIRCHALNVAWQLQPGAVILHADATRPCFWCQLLVRHVAVIPEVCGWDTCGATRTGASGVSRRWINSDVVGRRCRPTQRRRLVTSERITLRLPPRPNAVSKWHDLINEWLGEGSVCVYSVWPAHQWTTTSGTTTTTTTTTTTAPPPAPHTHARRTITRHSNYRVRFLASDTSPR